MFVSISFIVLMMISLAWLVFYYIQRFRYLHAKDRLSVTHNHYTDDNDNETDWAAGLIHSHRIESARRLLTALVPSILTDSSLFVLFFVCWFILAGAEQCSRESPVQDSHPKRQDVRQGTRRELQVGVWRLPFEITPPLTSPQHWASLSHSWRVLIMKILQLDKK